MNMNGTSRTQTLAILALFATAFPACRANHTELGKQGDVTTETSETVQTQPNTVTTETDVVDVYGTEPTTTSSATTIAPGPATTTQTEPAPTAKTTEKSHKAAKAAAAGAAVGGAAVASQQPTETDIVLDDMESEMDSQVDQEDEMALLDEEDGLTPEETYIEEDVFITPEREPASTMAIENQDGDKLLTQKPGLGLDYEPHSVWSKTGTLGMTGIDRSHEQFSKTEPIFVDARIAQYQPAATFVPLSSINFEKYSHSDRRELQTVANNYVDQIEDDVVDMRGEARALENPPAGYKQSFKDITKQEDQVRESIAKAPKVDAANWSDYRDGLHQQISDLEQSYADIRLSMRE